MVTLAQILQREYTVKIKNATLKMRSTITSRGQTVIPATMVIVAGW
jgi:hypothetical protein